jgi:hypothetical protein
MCIVSPAHRGKPASVPPKSNLESEVTASYDNNKDRYACGSEYRRSWSMLNGYSAQLAKRKAPPAAENTEKSSGALIPSATVIVAASSRSKNPLKKAVVRVCHPSTSKISKRISAQVATMATVGTAALGKNQLSALDRPLNTSGATEGQAELRARSPK